MVELVLHFDAGADAEAVATQLRQQAAALQGVDSAEAETYHQRGVTEIILVLGLAATVLNSGAATLDALKRFIESCKGLGGTLGLGNLRIEIGSKVLTPAELTPEHASRIETGT